jgi:hypothetical protein
MSEHENNTSCVFLAQPESSIEIILCPLGSALKQNDEDHIYRSEHSGEQRKTTMMLESTGHEFDEFVVYIIIDQGYFVK